MEQLRRVIVGQGEVIDQILAAIFTRGHCLLVGVPGLAKTLMVSSISQILSTTFKRVQFTPDLMPSDITGTMVLEELPDGKREFRFVRGPIFANVVLADEINRTPPKTQAALLEAMQERQVTAGQDTMKLPDPFFVIATQNPIEQEGTYPLPEAQLDRFMFNIKVDYPTTDEERLIVAMTARDTMPEMAKVLTGERIVAWQKLVRKIEVPLDTEPAVVFHPELPGFHVKRAKIKTKFRFGRNDPAQFKSVEDLAFATVPQLAELIEHFLGLEATTHLSRAALETLAIIAYQQPVTRPQIDAIRGVNSDSMLKSLLHKGLILESGRADGPGRPILYSTTPEFLQHFGLNSILEMPRLATAEDDEKHDEMLKG